MADAIELDLRGLKCPLPVLLTRKALRRMAPGDIVTVLATDPLAPLDIPHLLQTDGHTLADQSLDGAVARFVIVKQVT